MEEEKQVIRWGGIVMEKEYTYSAFISYSSKDEKIAKSLWKKLERYRLPAVLQKQYEDIPEKMHIFLDQGDIVPGDTVENALSRELADSKKLIVICSPNSAVSPYVELEVKNFLSLGHSTNDIIPYIIDGEVDKNSTNNCYVPSLFGASDKDTLNGVSVIRDGKWKAFVGVLANLLDVKFDEIYKREKVRKNRITAAWGGLGFLIACFIGLVIWYVTPHTKYYMDYITKWGIPIGIYELNKKQIKQEFEHYEITTQFGRPVKLIHADYFGKPKLQDYTFNHFNRPKIATYKYNNGIKPFVSMKNWKISSIYYTFDRPGGDSIDDVFGDEDGYTVLLEVNDNSEKDNSVMIDFYYGKGVRERKSLSNDFLAPECFFYSDVTKLITSDSDFSNLGIEPPDTHFLMDISSIFQFRISYDENGFEETVDFYNYNKKESWDKNEIKGYINNHDLLGRISSQTLKYKNPKYDLPHEIIYSYDDSGHLCFMGYTSSYGENVFNPKRNFSSCICSFAKDYDSMICYDEVGNPIDAINKQFYKGEETRIDEFTFEAKSWSTKLDEDNSYYKTTLIKKNNTVEITESIIKDGNEKKCIYSYAEKIDNTKTVVHFLVYDSDGTMDHEETIVRETEIINEKKAKKTIYSDSRQNEDITSYKFYDAHERLISEKTPVSDGILECKLEYEGDNKSISYYLDGNVYLRNYDNYAQANFLYNNNNQLISCDFRDANNEYITSPFWGFAKYEAKYNTNGLKLEEFFLSPDNTPVFSNCFGYAEYSAKDSFNHEYLTSFKYMDDKGELIKPNGKYSNMKSEIDGNLRNSYYYELDKLARINSFENEKNIGGKLYGYETNGDCIIFYIDSLERYSGKEVFNSDGILIDKRLVEYKDNAEIVKNYFPSNLDLVANEEIKYADGSSVYKEYSLSDNNTWEVQFDSRKRPISWVQYNETGEKTNEISHYYNKDGTILRKYFNYLNGDEGIFHCDKTGQMINTSEGYCATGFGFDENNIKRKVVLKADENGELSSLSNMAGKVVQITDVFQGSSAQKMGISVGDLILVYGEYDYFPNGSESELLNNIEKGMNKSLMITCYRPSELRFYSYIFEPGSKGFEYKFVYAGSSIEESEKYINKLQKKYNKWQKNNK